MEIAAAVSHQISPRQSQMPPPYLSSSQNISTLMTDLVHEGCGIRQTQKVILSRRWRCMRLSFDKQEPVHPGALRAIFILSGNIRAARSGALVGLGSDSCPSKVTRKLGSLPCMDPGEERKRILIGLPTKKIRRPKKKSLGERILRKDKA